MLLKIRKEGIDLFCRIEIIPMKMKVKKYTVPDKRRDIIFNNADETSFYFDKKR
ncbi:hypothetical protein ALO_15342 [Acetonema longum DSM 6540]|uniref:Uncharacterized protein n=1 Tax=Acetonema longum DSM 6540 TaxID=1009370 RepID=F7NLU4_9FIRM|nr:hypothetical protein ALO_15342 [Acetonema longum DSM 6540]